MCKNLYKVFYRCLYTDNPEKLINSFILVEASSRTEARSKVIDHLRSNIFIDAFSVYYSLVFSDYEKT